MKLRSRKTDDAFDGLTAEEIRRIRGAAEASVTPGLEGLVGKRPNTAPELGEPYAPPVQTAKRGRRA